MSRIGRMPIAVPAGVTVEIAENNKVTVKGPKGTLERGLAHLLLVNSLDNDDILSLKDGFNALRVLHLNRMGVAQGNCHRKESCGKRDPERCL